MIKVIAILATAAAFSLHAQPAPQLLRDINTTGRDSSRPAGFVSDGRVSWFFATDENGRELWRTDGTTQGTRMVRDIAPGPVSSITEPNQGMVISGDYVYFWAVDHSYVLNLWRSDGTSTGTIRLTSLGKEHQSPGAVAAIGTHGAVFTNGAATTLYVTDGSREGTALLADGFNSYAFERFARIRDIVYFAGESGLWRTDGTAAGTRRVAQLGSSTLIRQLIELNGTLFLVVRGDSFEDSYEICRSDGTATGTQSFATFKTELPLLQVVRGSLYIVVPSAGLETTEIWRSDGTANGTGKAVVVPGGFQAGFNVAGATDDLLFFSVDDESLNVRRTVVWRSDGTAPGTWSVDIFDSTYLAAAATHNAFFLSRAGTGLWKTTGAPVEMEKISPVFFEELAAHGNRIVGSAADSDHGQELWTSDGTAAGTNLLKNIFADGNSWGWQPRKLGKDHILFSAPDDQNGFEPWTTDGTTSGTHLVADINPGANSSYPLNFSDLGNGNAVFSAAEPSHGRELWVTDGSAAGTHQVRDIAKGKYDALGASSSPADFPVIGGRALFFAYESDGLVHGDGLWSSDGTDSGTARVASGGSFGGDAFAAGDAAYVGTTAGYLKSNGTEEGTIVLADNGNTLGVARSKVFFRGTGFDHSSELWVTDGTPAGTRLVKNIHPHSPNESIEVFPYPYDAAAPVGDALFFFADDGIHGTELWRSDGTEAGTSLVKDIAPGSTSSFVEIVEGSAMTEYHGLLYFVADDWIHGAELWRSDGTAQGTYMVKDINPDGPSSFPASLTVMFDRLYFSAEDGVHGRELWSTDGATTALVCDLNPGPDSSAPRDFIALHSSIIFFATRNDVGRELWKLDAPPSRHRPSR